MGMSLTENKGQLALRNGVSAQPVALVARVSQTKQVSHIWFPDQSDTAAVSA